MLSRQRQLITKLHKLLDAGLFGVAFWLAHAIRSVDALDPNRLIKEFDAYAWLLLVIVPLNARQLRVRQLRGKARANAAGQGPCRDWNANACSWR